MYLQHPTANVDLNPQGILMSMAFTSEFVETDISAFSAIVCLLSAVISRHGCDTHFVSSNTSVLEIPLGHLR